MQQHIRWGLKLAEHQCTKCFDKTGVAPQNWIEALTGGMLNFPGEPSLKPAQK